jgi:hypothetical protein
MAKHLPKRRQEFSATSEKKTVRDIKEKLFSVVLAFDAEMQKAALSSEIDSPDELPAGKVITVGSERL